MAQSRGLLERGLNREDGLVELLWYSKKIGTFAFHKTWVLQLIKTGMHQAMPSRNAPSPPNAAVIQRKGHCRMLPVTENLKKVYLFIIYKIYSNYIIVACK